MPGQMASLPCRAAASVPMENRLVCPVNLGTDKETGAPGGHGPFREKAHSVDLASHGETSQWLIFNVPKRNAARNALLHGGWW